jgi:hypothetical protein
MNKAIEWLKENCYPETLPTISRDYLALILERYAAQFTQEQKPIGNVDAFKGSSILQDLCQAAAIKNEDGMPVIKYVDKPNGGSVAYVRHDAMVNKLNTLVKEYKQFQAEQKPNVWVDVKELPEVAEEEYPIERYGIEEQLKRIQSSYQINKK